MKNSFLLLILLFFCSCTPKEQFVRHYPDCYFSSGISVGFCLVGEFTPEKELGLIGKLELGFEAYKEIFVVEWQEKDILDAFSRIVVFFGEIKKDDRCPCSENSNSCESWNHSIAYDELWVNSHYWNRGREEWTEINLTSTALLHEITHSMEYQIEGTTDHKHEVYSWRWDTLERSAIERWKEYLGE